MTTNFQTSVFFIIEISPKQWFQTLHQYWMEESKGLHFSLSFLRYLFLLFLFWKVTHLKQKCISFGENCLLQSVLSGILVFHHYRSELLDLASLHTILYSPPPHSPSLPLLPPKKKEVIKTDQVAKFSISQTWKHSRKEQACWFCTCTVL